MGTGNAGATFAYALLLSGLAAEIVLIDVKRAKTEGEVMDSTMPFPSPIQPKSEPATSRTAPRHRLWCLLGPPTRSQEKRGWT